MFQYNLIPKAVLSLKVLQELPIIVVLMYQLYKQNVHQDVADYIPLIMNTITLAPSPQHRANPAFNKEVFVDFMGAQIKTLSFLAYIIRIYQEVVAQHAPLMVKGMLGLLTLCPMEVAHLRKELLIAARHILATDLRISKFTDNFILVVSVCLCIHVTVLISGSKIQTQPRLVDFVGGIKSKVQLPLDEKVKPLIPCSRFTLCKRTLVSTVPFTEMLTAHSG